MNLRGIEVGALVRTRLRPKDRGRLFLGVLTHDAPSLSPEFYGVFEPVRTPFNAAELPAILAKWGERFLWRRARPRLSGHVVHAPENAHDVVYLSLTPSAFEVSVVNSFLSGLRHAFGLELAYIHGRAAADISDREVYVRQIMPFSQGLTTHELREGLPGFPWMLFFGPAYVELFGRARLLATPAAHVESTGDGVSVWLTSSISDCAKARSEVQAASERARQYLDKNAFRAPGIRCRVPQFVFDEQLR